MCPGRYVDVFGATAAGSQDAQVCVEERGRVTLMIAGLTGHEEARLP